MARVIASTISGPFILSLSDPLATGGSDTPLTITSMGAIDSASDGIDGDAGTFWTIANHGTVSAGGDGILLAGSGALVNSGIIETQSASIANDAVEIDGFGLLSNTGTISSGYANALTMGCGIVRNTNFIISLEGHGISLGTGLVVNAGTVYGGLTVGSGEVVNSGTFGSLGIGYDGVQLGTGTIRNSGSIDSRSVAVTVGDDSSFINSNTGEVHGRSVSFSGGNGVSVANAGTVLGGEFGCVNLGDNGLVTNSGSIGGSTGVILGANGRLINTGTIGGEQVAASLQSGRLSNKGTIQGQAVIADGGIVDNSGSITLGVEIQSGSGTVINSGVLAATGTKDSVTFDAGTTDNLLVVDPTATFTGGVVAPIGSNSTIELAAGMAAISGVGTGQFNGFDTMSVNAKAAWTLNGADTIGTVLNNGTLVVAGSFDVTAAVDPASKGVFSLAGGATLEVEAALGAKSAISFAAPSELIVDNAAGFGVNVGTGGYAGMLLENFASGAVIDLKDFGSSDLGDRYAAATGLLQITNGASQVATLHFQNASLGSGSFHFNSDGAGGLLITHA